MQAEIKTILAGTAFIIFFGIFSYAVMTRSEALENREVAATGSWACTADAETCPDGSLVYRTPPYCHFASCKNQ